MVVRECGGKMTDAIDKAIKARRESKYVEFKESFDLQSKGDWCELIKDIVAMANSGGGIILIGIANNGLHSGADVADVINLDNAVLVDKISKYTGGRCPTVEIHEAQKARQPFAVMEVSPTENLIVFENVGNYEYAPGKQKNAFSVGTIYFRHGAKSEPGISVDVEQALDRRLEAIRSAWMDGVKKVVKAPLGSSISVFSGDVVESGAPGATPIRLVDDPDAPGYRIIDHDTTYPYRQVELISVVNGMLPDGVTINSRDVQAIRKTGDVAGDPKFMHTPKFGTTQYSNHFATWIVNRYKGDVQFFEAARRAYAEIMHH